MRLMRFNVCRSQGILRPRPRAPGPLPPRPRPPRPRSPSLTTPRQTATPGDQTPQALLPSPLLRINSTASSAPSSLAPLAACRSLLQVLPKFFPRSPFVRLSRSGFVSVVRFSVASVSVAVISFRLVLMLAYGSSLAHRTELHT